MIANNTPTMWSPKFTDEDLAKLKKCVRPETEKLDVGLFDWTTHSPVAVNIAALITRLEAAEKYIEIGALTQSVTPNDLAMAELKWRESAGKLD